MIEEIKGDVFKAKEKVLIHGVNCFNTWGAGIAKRMKELYPEAYEADLKTQKGDENKLGDFTFWTGNHYYYYETPIVVINLYSQYNYGSGLQVNYNAIAEGLEAIEFIFRGMSFAMPKIGAGLAGGNWTTIKHKITDVFTGYKRNELVRIYYL